MCDGGWVAKRSEGVVGAAGVKTTVRTRRNAMVKRPEDDQLGAGTWCGKVARALN